MAKQESETEIKEEIKEEAKGEPVETKEEEVATAVVEEEPEKEVKEEPAAKPDKTDQIFEQLGQIRTQLAPKEAERPLKQYTKRELFAMKQQYPQYAAAIDEEVDKRNEEYAVTQAQKTVDKKVSEMTVANLHKDFTNPDSRLFKTFTNYIAQDPDIVNRPNGLLMAAKSALHDLGMTEAKKVKTEARKELLNQLEGAGRQTILKGSGAAGKITREQGIDQMNDADFEAMVHDTKFKGG